MSRWELVGREGGRFPVALLYTRPFGVYVSWRIPTGWVRFAHCKNGKVRPGLKLTAVRYRCFRVGVGPRFNGVFVWTARRAGSFKAIYGSRSRLARLMDGL